jgi:hypothetical protein
LLGQSTDDSNLFFENAKRQFDTISTLFDRSKYDEDETNEANDDMSALTNAPSVVENTGDEEIPKPKSDPIPRYYVAIKL